MKIGKPIRREWLLILNDGRAVLDWGDQQYQDLLTGDFTSVTEFEISHTASDTDLEILKRSGQITDYDAGQVYLLSLPEKDRKTIG